MPNSARTLVLLLLLIGALGMAFTGAPLYSRLAYLALLVLASSWLWTWLSLRGVGLQRRARTLRASVGDIFEETFEIDNPSRLPRLWLEVCNESTLPQAAGSRLLTGLGGRQKRTYLARTWLTRRGAYPLGPTRLASGDPFGLFTVRRMLPAVDSLLVLPLILPVGDFPSPAGILPGGRARRQKAAEITPHASGLREYAPGDPLKRIHWPSTARRGKLMVKEFEQDPQAEIWLILDAQARWQAEIADNSPKIWQDWMFTRRPELSLPPATLEYAVSLAASLTHLFTRQRRAVGFVTEAPVFTVIRAERSERQEGKILETLAFVRGEGRLPLVSLVEAQSAQIPPGSSVVLITACADESLLLAAETLLRRGQHPLVLHLMAETFGGSSGGEAIYAKLLARGVTACKISRGDNLTEALAHFTP
ncbi:MAG: hypothetical protein CO094_09780 [Anaerolineae bacterium CG_4_9_14_3_um_filter_57_17]|nr:DUF58 domain-containing protein [bacterium]NCQ82765.1 DUF58 domain-containing protein [bacterium]NCT21729.1 DUF58 domain-containing protein [bacterium]OIO84561.1 MAG: hypothetical protein AUK01_09095 [Anaerolineae bacterium CG2_30_57_67]PJB65548.1 MAG: hypothetical protein CO094_09780 [Anaerolineae bacterium CG_4_9_14_3_um_filter_57_17]